MMRPLFVILAAFVSGCGGSGGPAVQPTPELPALPAAAALNYELVPGGHLVAFLATDMFETLYQESQTLGVPSDLISAGYSLISFDLPCHGTDASESIPLVCWRDRLEAGEFDLFTEFCAGFSATLDELGVTEMSIVGQSRGAYVATICASYDPRVVNLVLIAPVTDLQRLREFNGYSVDQDIFNLGKYAPYIRNRNVLVRVNSVDERIGTDEAIDFSALVGAELDIVDLAAHAVPNDGRVTTWLIAKTTRPGE